MKLGLLIGGVMAAMAPLAAADAAVVLTTSVVTGGPGAYTHMFTLTNNIGGTNDVYFFGVDLAGTIVGTPASWAASGNQNANWSNASSGGSGTIYPNTWCCVSGGAPSGSSVTGFAVLSAVNPETVRFFVFAFGGTAPVDSGFFNTPSNPGYEGIVNAPSGVVPEPTSWAMLIAGFGLVGALQRRRKTVVAA